MNGVFCFLCGCLFLLCFFLQHIHKDGNGHEGAVFSHSGVKRCLIQKFLAVCADKEGDGCAAFGSFTGLHFIINAAVAAPFCRLCTLLIGKGINLDCIGYHKSRIEPQTEMSDNLTAFVLGFSFKFGKEIGCTGECNLVDVFLDFICRHADTVINNLQCFLVLIQNNMNFVCFLCENIRFPHHGKLLQLCHRITRIGYQFTNEDVLICIEPFFDNWHKIFTVNRKIAFFLHTAYLLKFFYRANVFGSHHSIL